MEQAALQLEDKERRVKLYKNDPFIKAVHDKIFQINCYAKPHIKVCIDNPEKSIFGIDEQSQKRIDWWMATLKEYVNNNYSDIIQVD